ncbi:DUF2190 family protein [Pasteurella oralis]|uniref:DUF2190 family protein n=1 Tax=Pasteurella oralis TaxID=1071947 RepID=A0ABW4NVB1_9PAST
MAKNYIQDGDTLRFTATKSVKSGDVVVVGEMVGIAITDVENKTQGVLRVTGVFNVKAKQSEDIKKGVLLYWDENAGEATTTKGSHKMLGKAWSDSGTSSTEVDVKLNV